MADSFPIEGAWDVLELAGEIYDPSATSWFLLKQIEHMAHNGERRRLMLVNCALDAYRNRPVTLVA